MKKIFICFIIFASMFFVRIPVLVAWSDDVSGVLMPSPRGGGGISGAEAESALSDSDEGESADPQVQVEWE